jgi:hypothetical protein
VTSCILGPGAGGRLGIKIVAMYSMRYSEAVFLACNQDATLEFGMENVASWLSFS